MNNLLMIGFVPDINVKINKYNTIHHNPFQMEGGMSPKEYKILCNRIILDTSIVLLNLDKKWLTFDESFLLVKAYSNNIPIIGIGKIRDEALYMVLSNTFEFMEDAINHLKNNY